MVDELVDSIASAIADGTEVDWDAAHARAAPDEVGLVNTFRRIARVLTATGAPCLRRPPTRWGSLVLAEELGAGAAGKVFRARDENLQRDVALKLVASSRAPKHARTHALGEARLLAKLRHPNVVSVYGADEIDGWVGMWMELLEGQTLAQRVVDSGPVDGEEAASLGIHVCQGLAAAHSRGIVHRDIKAQNIIREPGGRTVLMDFGLGLSGGDPSAGNELAGTPLYMAPELFKGTGPSVRSDLYAVGVVLFYMVTGSYPVIGSDLASLRAAHESGERQYLRDLRADLPGSFVAAVERVLSFDPTDRPASAGEFEQLLRAALLPAERRGRPRYTTALGLAAGVVLLVTGVVAGPVWWGSRDTPVGARVAIGEFTNATSDSDLDGVGQVLATELGQSNRFEIVGMGEPSEPPTPSADAVVSANLSQIGRIYKLGVRIEVLEPPRRRRRLLDEFDVTVDGSDAIFDAIDEAAVWVRRRLGEGAADIRRADLLARDATTTSWLALTLYRRSFDAYDSGDQELALNLLERALEIDPEFALGRIRLGDIHAGKDLAVGVDHWRQVLRAENDERLTIPDRLHVEATLAQGVRDSAMALEAFTRWANLYPLEYRPLLGRALSLSDLGRDIEAALVLDQTRIRWPDNPLTLSRLAELRIDLGQYESARSLLRQLERHGARQPLWSAVARAYEGRLALITRRPDDALNSFRELTTSSDSYWASRGYQMLAAALAELDQAGAAVATLEEGLAFDQASVDDLGALSARKLLALSYLAEQTNRPDNAGRAALDAATRTRDPRVLARAGEVLARVGDLDSARMLLARFPTDPEPVFYVNRHRLEAAIALAEGEPRRAAELVMAAARIDVPSTDRNYVAAALLAAGNARGACDALRQAVEHPTWMMREELVWETMPGFLTATSLEAARCLAQSGSMEAAEGALSMYLDLRFPTLGADDRARVAGEAMDNSAGQEGNRRLPSP